MLGCRALTKLMSSWKFVTDAKETLLDAGEREKLLLEGHTPIQPAKRKLDYAYNAEDGAESGDETIPPSGTPTVQQHFEDSQIIHIW